MLTWGVGGGLNSIRFKSRKKRKRDRETEKQIDRETDRQRDRETERKNTCQMLDLKVWWQFEQIKNEIKKQGCQIWNKKEREGEGGREREREREREEEREGERGS